MNQMPLLDLPPVPSAKALKRQEPTETALLTVTELALVQRVTRRLSEKTIAAARKNGAVQTVEAERRARGKHNDVTAMQTSLIEQSASLFAIAMAILQRAEEIRVEPVKAPKKEAPTVAKKRGRMPSPPRKSAEPDENEAPVPLHMRGKRDADLTKLPKAPPGAR